MTKQIDWLNPPAIITVPATKHLSINAAFEEFHRLNPEIYARLVILSRTALAAGRIRIGIGALWERMRWDYMLSSTGDMYKLNNNFRSRYARLIAKNEPQLSSLFAFRTLRSP